MIDLRAHPNTILDQIFRCSDQMRYGEESPFSSYGTDSEDPYYNAWLNGLDPCQEDPNNGTLEKVEWKKEGF